MILGPSVAAAAGLFDTLGASSSVGATSVTLSYALLSAFDDTTYIAIDAGTTQCEVRRITGISGTTVSFPGDVLRYSHASGDAIVIFTGPAAHAGWWGVKPDGSTDNGTALNAALAELAQTADINILALSPGIIGTTIPVDVYFGQTLFGAGPSSGSYGTTIKALAGFSFSTQDVAVIRTRDSSGNLVKRSAITYINTQQYLWNLRVDANSISGGNGILASQQQPSQWGSLWVGNCLGSYGLCLHAGQDLSIYKLQFQNCALALDHKGQDFLKIYDLNIEGGVGTRDIWVHADTSGGRPNMCSYMGGHMEPGAAGTSETCFDIDDARGLLIESYFYSTPTDASNYTVFDIENASGNVIQYVIQAVQVTGGTGSNITTLNNHDKPEVIDGQTNDGFLEWTSTTA